MSQFFFNLFLCLLILCGLLLIVDAQNNALFIDTETRHEYIDPEGTKPLFGNDKEDWTPFGFCRSWNQLYSDSKGYYCEQQCSSSNSFGWYQSYLGGGLDVFDRTERTTTAPSEYDKDELGNTYFMSWPPYSSQAISGFSWRGYRTPVIIPGNQFRLGTFSHRNWVIDGRTQVCNLINLLFSFQFSTLNDFNEVVQVDFTLDMVFRETPNTASSGDYDSTIGREVYPTARGNGYKQCPYIPQTWFIEEQCGGLPNWRLDSEADLNDPCRSTDNSDYCGGSNVCRCGDRVEFKNANALTTAVELEFPLSAPGRKFYVAVSGFLDDRTGELVNYFNTREDEISSATIWGVLEEACDVAGDCDDGLECTINECINGVYTFDYCSYTPDDSVCNSPPEGAECWVGRCDATLGCVYEPKDEDCESTCCSDQLKCQTCPECPATLSEATFDKMNAALSSTYEYDPDTDKTTFTYSLGDFDHRYSWDEDNFNHLSIILNPGIPAENQGSCFRPIILDNTVLDPSFSSILTAASSHSVNAEQLLTQGSGTYAGKNGDWSNHVIRWNKIGAGDEIVLSTGNANDFGIFNMPIVTPATSCDVTGDSGIPQNWYIQDFLDGVEQSKLNEIRTVKPFTNNDVVNMCGERYIAVIYPDAVETDSICNVDDPSFYADLTGYRRGFLFFEVVEVIPNPSYDIKDPASNFAQIRIRILDDFEQFGYEICNFDNYDPCTEALITAFSEGYSLQNGDPSIVAGGYGDEYGFATSFLVRWPDGISEKLTITVDGEVHAEVQHAAALMYIDGSPCTFLTTTLVPTCYNKDCPSLGQGVILADGTNPKYPGAGYAGHGTSGITSSSLLAAFSYHDTCNIYGDPAPPVVQLLDPEGADYSAHCYYSVGFIEENPSSTLEWISEIHNINNNPTNIIHARLSVSPEFCDNSYGSSIDDLCDWPATSRSLNDIMESDKATFVIQNDAGEVLFRFALDYLSSSDEGSISNSDSYYDSPPTKYFTASKGNTEIFEPNNYNVDQLIWKAQSSLDHNLNICYSDSVDQLAQNSPDRSSNYDALETKWSLWDYRVVYDVYFYADVFGNDGFHLSIESVHCSPSKDEGGLGTELFFEGHDCPQCFFTPPEFTCDVPCIPCDTYCSCSEGTAYQSNDEYGCLPCVEDLGLDCTSGAYESGYFEHPIETFIDADGNSFQAENLCECVPCPDYDCPPNQEKDLTKSGYCNEECKECIDPLCLDTQVNPGKNYTFLEDGVTIDKCKPCVDCTEITCKTDEYHTDSPQNCYCAPCPCLSGNTCDSCAEGSYRLDGCDNNSPNSYTGLLEDCPTRDRCAGCDSCIKPDCTAANITNFPDDDCRRECKNCTELETCPTCTSLGSESSPYRVDPEDICKCIPCSDDHCRENEVLSKSAIEDCSELCPCVCKWNSLNRPDSDNCKQTDLKTYFNSSECDCFSCYDAEGPDQFHACSNFENDGLKHCDDPSFDGLKTCNADTHTISTDGCECNPCKNSDGNTCCEENFNCETVGPNYIYCGDEFCGYQNSTDCCCPVDKIKPTCLPCENGEIFNESICNCEICPLEAVGTDEALRRQFCYDQNGTDFVPASNCKCDCEPCDQQAKKAECLANRQRVKPGFPCECDDCPTDQCEDGYTLDLSIADLDDMCPCVCTRTCDTCQFVLNATECTCDTCELLKQPEATRDQWCIDNNQGDNWKQDDDCPCDCKQCDVAAAAQVCANKNQKPDPDAPCFCMDCPTCDENQQRNWKLVNVTSDEFCPCECEPCDLCFNVLESFPNCTCSTCPLLQVPEADRDQWCIDNNQGDNWKQDGDCPCDCEQCDISESALTERRKFCASLKKRLDEDRPCFCEECPESVCSYPFERRADLDNGDYCPCDCAFSSDNRPNTCNNVKSYWLGDTICDCASCGEAGAPPARIACSGGLQLDEYQSCVGVNETLACDQDTHEIGDDFCSCTNCTNSDGDQCCLERYDCSVHGNNWVHCADGCGAHDKTDCCCPLTASDCTGLTPIFDAENCTCTDCSDDPYVYCNSTAGSLEPGCTTATLNDSPDEPNDATNDTRTDRQCNIANEALRPTLCGCVNVVCVKSEWPDCTDPKNGGGPGFIVDTSTLQIGSCEANCTCGETPYSPTETTCNTTHTQWVEEDCRCYPCGGHADVPAEFVGCGTNTTQDCSAVSSPQKPCNLNHNTLSVDGCSCNPCKNSAGLQCCIPPYDCTGSLGDNYVYTVNEFCGFQNNSDCECPQSKRDECLSDPCNLIFDGIACECKPCELRNATKYPTTQDKDAYCAAQNGTGFRWSGEDCACSCEECIPSEQKLVCEQLTRNSGVPPTFYELNETDTCQCQTCSTPCESPYVRLLSKITIDDPCPCECPLNEDSCDYCDGQIFNNDTCTCDDCELWALADIDARDAWCRANNSVHHEWNSECNCDCKECKESEQFARCAAITPGFWEADPNSYCNCTQCEDNCVFPKVRRRSDVTEQDPCPCVCSDEYQPARCEQIQFIELGLTEYNETTCDCDQCEFLIQHQNETVRIQACKDLDGVNATWNKAVPCECKPCDVQATWIKCISEGKTIANDCDCKSCPDCPPNQVYDPDNATPENPCPCKCPWSEQVQPSSCNEVNSVWVQDECDCFPCTSEYVNETSYEECDFDINTSTKNCSDVVDHEPCNIKTHTMSSDSCDCDCDTEKHFDCERYGSCEGWWERDVEDCGTATEQDCSCKYTNDNHPDCGSTDLIFDNVTCCCVPCPLSLLSEDQSKDWCNREYNDTRFERNATHPCECQSCECTPVDGETVYNTTEDGFTDYCSCIPCTPVPCTENQYIHPDDIGKRCPRCLDCDECLEGSMHTHFNESFYNSTENFEDCHKCNSGRFPTSFIDYDPQNPLWVEGVNFTRVPDRCGECQPCSNPCSSDNGEVRCPNEECDQSTGVYPCCPCDPYDGTGVECKLSLGLNYSHWLGPGQPNYCKGCVPCPEPDNLICEAPKQKPVSLLNKCNRDCEPCDCIDGSAYVLSSDGITEYIPTLLEWGNINSDYWQCHTCDSGQIPISYVNITIDNSTYSVPNRCDGCRDCNATDFTCLTQENQVKKDDLCGCLVCSCVNSADSGYIEVEVFESFTEQQKQECATCPFGYYPLQLVNITSGEIVNNTFGTDSADIPSGFDIWRCGGCGVCTFITKTECGQHERPDLTVDPCLQKCISCNEPECEPGLDFPPNADWCDAPAAYDQYLKWLVPCTVDQCDVYDVNGTVIDTIDYSPLLHDIVNDTCGCTCRDCDGCSGQPGFELCIPGDLCSGCCACLPSNFTGCEFGETLADDGCTCTNCTELGIPIVATECEEGFYIDPFTGCGCISCPPGGCPCVGDCSVDCPPEDEQRALCEAWAQDPENVQLVVGCPCEDCPGVVDECGICNGDNSSCTDCFGGFGGEIWVDDCGYICGDSSKCPSPYCENNDRCGICVDIIDLCGICGGNSSTCYGCDYVPASGKEYDDCGVCDGNNDTCWGDDDDDTATIAVAIVAAIIASAGALFAVAFICRIKKRPDLLIGEWDDLLDDSLNMLHENPLSVANAENQNALFELLPELAQDQDFANDVGDLLNDL